MSSRIPSPDQLASIRLQAQRHLAVLLRCLEECRAGVAPYTGEAWDEHSATLVALHKALIAGQALSPFGWSESTCEALRDLSGYTRSRRGFLTEEDKSRDAVIKRLPTIISAVEKAVATLKAVPDRGSDPLTDPSAGRWSTSLNDIMLEFDQKQKEYKSFFISMNAVRDKPFEGAETLDGLINIVIEHENWREACNKALDQYRSRFTAGGSDSVSAAASYNQHVAENAFFEAWHRDRLARTPGVERIDIYCNKEWGEDLSSKNLRLIRGRLGFGAGTMTVEEVADKLERADTFAANRRAGATTPSNPAAKPRRRKGGRPPDTDPKEDSRIAEAWKTGRYATYKDCANALGKSDPEEVERALDRHRKRVGKTQSRKPRQGD